MVFDLHGRREPDGVLLGNVARRPRKEARFRTRARFAHEKRHPTGLAQKVPLPSFAGGCNRLLGGREAGELDATRKGILRHIANSASEADLIARMIAAEEAARRSTISRGLRRPAGIARRRGRGTGSLG